MKVDLIASTPTPELVENKYKVEVEPVTPLYYCYTDERRTTIVSTGWCVMMIDDLFADDIVLVTSDNVKELLNLAYNEWGVKLKSV